MNMVAAASVFVVADDVSIIGRNVIQFTDIGSTVFQNAQFTECFGHEHSRFGHEMPHTASSAGQQWRFDVPMLWDKMVNGVQRLTRKLSVEQ